MNFGKIDHYILFGGGKLLCLTALQLQKEFFSVFVVTSERHSTEPIIINNNTTSFADFLQNNNIDYVISEDVSRDSMVINKITKHTAGISFGAAWIFSKQFIDILEGRLVNCHGARLPQDRGAGGFSWRILRSERVGVCLIHQIDEGIDTGDIILFEEYFYPHCCRYPIDYQAFSVVKYQNLLKKFCYLLKREKTFQPVAQPEYLSSYWPRLSTDIHGYIDWCWDLKSIERFTCAFDDPYKGASTFLNNKRVRLKKCYSSSNDGVFHPFQKGFIYRITEETIFVSAEQGTLLVNSVLNENGYDIKKSIRVGQRFYTPAKYIEEAKGYEAIYTPSV